MKKKDIFDRKMSKEIASIFTILFVIFVTSMVYLMSGVLILKFVEFYMIKDKKRIQVVLRVVVKILTDRKLSYICHHNYYYIEELFKKNTIHQFAQ